MSIKTLDQNSELKSIEDELKELRNEVSDLRAELYQKDTLISFCKQQLHSKRGLS